MIISPWLVIITLWWPLHGTMHTFQIPAVNEQHCEAIYEQYSEAIYEQYSEKFLGGIAAEEGLHVFGVCVDARGNMTTRRDAIF